MKNLKVIKGNASYLEEALEPLIEGALSYFGPRYEPIVTSTLENTYFYEQGPLETKEDVLSCLIGNSGCEKQKSTKWNLQEASSYYLLAKQVNSKKYDQFVVYHNMPKDQLKCQIAHELFGHAVCGHVEKIVEENGKLYQRNGLCLMRTDENHHILASEGFMELIKYEVLKASRISITDEMLCANYLVPYMNALFVKDHLGKKMVLDHLVLNQGNIVKALNEQVQEKCFEQLENLSERWFLTSPKKRKPIFKEMLETQKQYTLKK